MKYTRLVFGGAATAAVTLLAFTGAAAAASDGPTGTVVSTCDNPVLNADLDGWGAVSGSAPFRYPLAGTAGPHADATAAYVQANNPDPNPRAWLPQMPVRAGQQWTFAVDTRTDVPGTGRILVDWYSTPDGDNTGFLGQTAGVDVPLPAASAATWYRMAGDFTAPAGAVRANVLADATLPAGADFSLTGCEYKPTAGGDVTPPPTSTEPPPTSTTEPPPTTSTPPPAADTAAAIHGWGTPIAAGSDEFNGTSLDTSKWGQPDGCWPANDTVQGGRCASHNSVHDGYLDEHGTADGVTGYVSSKFNQHYGRWEARMRVRTTAPGNAFHPVLLTWPQSEQWPSGGELDYLEINSDSTHAQAFIHHTDGGQDAYTGPAIDFSQWHNYAVEWQPGHIRGFIDGVQWFDSTNSLSQPPGPHHATAQLDNFSGTSGMADVHMDVDWYRAYAAS